ncbi:peptidoglycan bridge formation glycyltransferase FemA/FemB family protein [Campylobacter hyointestinalis]|uniref:peptidoglycan bridge formation glycyltransferase FemA/FemB family protein n=1 Tax=Campylobacter hyointestinalis TaxID=198 RepID=UPI002578FB0A|nr:peptidoglycan bridge formation glycyltransferase FemA/FemB family protein [Campylobacter hyointestinalis]MDM1028422.1 peptidoglycan bridge formation glycyltransferase FemA/FemB family protein [Campylobacter hyointestinalis]
MKIVIKYNDFEELGYILANPNYLSMNSRNYGWICGYENKKLCYVVPFLEKKKWIFTYIQIQSSTIILNGSKEFEKEFLNLAIDKLRQIGKIDFISQPKTNAVFNIYPDNAIYCNFGSYIVNLSINEERLFDNIHTKHRNVIKRATINGVSVKFGYEVFNDAYDVIFDTLHRNNMSMIDKNSLIKFMSVNKKSYLIGCSYLDSIPQSAAIIFYDNYKGYYFWGGTSKNLSLGANNLLHWEIIKKLKSLGVQYYDFVGARINTKDERLLGIQRFKSRFGATLQCGYLWKYPIKKWKFNLFTKLYNFRMGKKDIIDEEKNSINI